MCDSCDDCNSISELVETPADSDDHIYCINGYKKYICKDGCKFICPECDEINIAHNEDGWFFDIICNECKLMFTPEFTWFGLDLPTSCDRYCLDGTSSLCKKLRQTLSDEPSNP